MPFPDLRTRELSKSRYRLPLAWCCHPATVPQHLPASEEAERMWTPFLTDRSSRPLVRTPRGLRRRGPFRLAPSESAPTRCTARPDRLRHTLHAVKSQVKGYFPIPRVLPRLSLSSPGKLALSTCLSTCRPQAHRREA